MTARDRLLDELSPAELLIAQHTRYAMFAVEIRNAKQAPHYARAIAAAARGFLADWRHLKTA